MPVSIDSKPLAADTLGLKTVGQVISHVQRSRRLVVNVLLDGREPDLANLQALRAAPLLGHTLFIETADPKQMAGSVLNDITTGLLESERLCDSAIEHLNNQTPAKAIEQLAGCLSIWQHVQESIEKIGQLLKLDTARINVRGIRFDKLLTDFTAQLRTIKSSLENRDYVLLNDTLTYEIAVAARTGTPRSTPCGRQSSKPDAIIVRMTATMLQELCELGSNELIKMQYLQAEKWLEQAATLARKQNDLDTLSRVYMPLQEARRQRRLRCGEGIVNLNLISHNSDDRIDGRRVVENFPHGQLLIAGWGCTAPAARVRELQKQYELYVESFLAAVFPTGGGQTVVLVPQADMKLPSPQERNAEELKSLLPAGCLILAESELIGPRPGDAVTFAEVSSLWERLHLPLLQAADAMPDSMEKIAAYERVIAVDYACELAHQNLSKTAHRLLRATPRA